MTSDTRGFDRRAALRALLASLFINALCPFLLYRVLEPRFGVGSVMPLVYATIFPVVGLLFGLIRKRTLDGIALLSMLGIAAHIAVTLAVGNIATALLVRSLDGVVIGLVLAISALIGRPIILYIVKQAAARQGPEHATRFGRLLENGGEHAFSTITIVWGTALALMSGVHIVLALNLAPATFLLVSPILGVGTVLLLGIWSGFYLRMRSRAAR